MIRTTAWAAFAVCLAACSGGPDGAAPRALEAVPDTASERRDDGPVVVVPYGDGYLAARTVTVADEAAVFDQSSIRFSTQVGNLALGPATSGYRAEVLLQATGRDEAEARKALSTMRVQSEDRVGGGGLKLDLAVVFDRYEAPSGSPQVVDGSVRSASIHGTVSGTAAHDVDLATRVGNATASGLDRVRARLSSDVGDLQASGGLSRLDAHTSVGSVVVAAAPSGSAQLTAATEIGNVEVALIGPLPGAFDVIGATDIGSAAVVVHGTEPVGDQAPNRAHFRSPGYASAAVQVEVNAHSRIGSVLVHD